MYAPVCLSQSCCAISSSSVSVAKPRIVCDADRALGRYDAHLCSTLGVFQPGPSDPGRTCLAALCFSRSELHKPTSLLPLAISLKCRLGQALVTVRECVRACVCSSSGTAEAVQWCDL